MRDGETNAVVASRCDTYEATSAATPGSTFKQDGSEVQVSLPSGSLHVEVCFIAELIDIGVHSTAALHLNTAISFREHSANFAELGVMEAGRRCVL